MRCRSGVAGVFALLVVACSDASAQSPGLTTTNSARAIESDKHTVAPTRGAPKPAKSTPTPAASDGKLPDRDKVNAVTVTIVTAPVGGAVSTMGSDMANVLDDGDNLRVLPILGKGSVQNLVDILRLKSVDMGFMMSDALEFVKTEYAVPDIENRVDYIAQMFDIEVHIVAPNEIKSVRDLEGKKIFAERNFGYYTLRNIFNRLHVTADVDSKTDIAGGLQKVLNGEGDAWVGDITKVAPLIRNINNESGKFHLVSVPFDRAIQDLYLPATLDSAEYPNLIPPGETVRTVAAPILLMVYHWPEGSDRYNRVAKFVDALFTRIDEFHKPPRHPKWIEVNIAATVPNLRRFKAAEDWLTLRRAAERANNVGRSTASDMTPDQLDEFLEWRRTRH